MQNCKELVGQASPKEPNAQALCQAIAELTWQTADPFPVQHEDGSVHWQGEGPVGPVGPSQFDKVLAGLT